MTKFTKPDADRFVSIRAEDHGFFASTAYYMEKYKIIFWFLAMFLVALGFDFRLPGQVMKNMQLQIDTLRVKAKQRDTNDEIYMRLWCASNSVSSRDKIISGLNCLRGDVK